MVNFSPRPIYPLEKNTGTLRAGGWVGPRVGLDVLYKKEISCLCLLRTPGRPTRSGVTIQPTLLRFPCNRCTANYTVNKNLNNIISEYCSNMHVCGFTPWKLRDISPNIWQSSFIRLILNSVDKFH